MLDTRRTFCDLTKTPELYNGKIVEVRAIILDGFEASLLRGEMCNAAIWLDAGFSVNTTTFGGDPIATGPPITLKKDAEFEKMAGYMSKPCGDSKYLDPSCSHAVLVTATGRFEHVDRMKVPPQDRRYAGFGHMNGYDSRFILQSVSNVESIQIDPRGPREEELNGSNRISAAVTVAARGFNRRRQYLNRASRFLAGQPHFDLIHP